MSASMWPWFTTALLKSRRDRQSLQEKGYVFTSDTDTEVVAHLIHSLYQGDLLALQGALGQLRGAYALAVTCLQEPGRVVEHVKVALVVGVGMGGTFWARSPRAIARYRPICISG